MSILSCWEIAKLVEYKRLTLTVPILDWITMALSYPGVRLLPLTPEIVVDSTRLPGTFHKDPADQMIVATARVNGLSLMTLDSKILAYSHVSLVEVWETSNILTHGDIGKLLPFERERIELQRT